VLDDDPAFRKLLLTLLDSGGWRTQAFASPREFGEQAAGLEPGILLLDVHLDGASGLEVLQGMPEVDRFAVVMVTGAGEIQTAVRAMKSGAVDFVQKPFNGKELLDRLERVHGDFAAEVLDETARADARQLVASLSGRERDVLERLLSGASNKLIARDLELSPRTVEMHRARKLDKLGVDTTAKALDIGRSAGVKPVSIA
jgi:two-component system response regulator FixJ